MENSELLAALDARFDRIDARFEQMDGRFEQIDSRFEQGDGAIATLRREMHALAEERMVQIQRVAEGVDGVNQRIERLETKVADEFGDVKSFLRLSYTHLERRLRRIEARHVR